MVKMVTLRASLLLAATFTALATLRVGVLPGTAPSPDPLRQETLNLIESQGWKREKDSRTGKKGQEMTTNDSHQFTKTSENPPIVMTLTPVRTRGPKTFRMSILTQETGLSSTKNGQLVSESESERIRILNQKEGTATEISCINNGRAIAEDKRLIREELLSGAHQTNYDRIKAIAGLAPVRQWDCLLIKISGPADADWNSLWKKTVPAVQDWDQKRR